MYLISSTWLVGGKDIQSIKSAVLICMQSIKSVFYFLLREIIKDIKPTHIHTQIICFTLLWIFGSELFKSAKNNESLESAKLIRIYGTKCSDEKRFHKIFKFLNIFIKYVNLWSKYSNKISRKIIPVKKKQINWEIQLKQLSFLWVVSLKLIF